MQRFSWRALFLVMFFMSPVCVCNVECTKDEETNILAHNVSKFSNSSVHSYYIECHFF